MKITKTELKNMIKECLSEILNKNNLMEDININELEFRNIGKNKISCYYHNKLIAKEYISSTGYIYWLDVKSKFRSQGIGTIMLQKALSRGGFWFHVEAPNIHAMNLYTRLGFIQLPDTNNQYLKLFVLKSKLEDYRKLEQKYNGNIKKMLGDMPQIADDMDDCNNNVPGSRTNYGEDGYQIEEINSENKLKLRQLKKKI